MEKVLRLSKRSNLRSINSKTILWLIVFLLMSSNSWGWRKECKEAVRFMKTGAYGQAIEPLEKALEYPKLRKNKRSKIEGMLHEAKLNAARSLFHRGKNFAKRNEVGKAVEAFKKAVEYNPQDVLYGKRLEEEQAKLDDIEEKVSRAYSLGVNDNKWDAALKKLESYRIYENSFPEIADNIKSFKKEASHFFLSKSGTHLMNQKYLRAYKSVDQALKYSNKADLRRMKNALHHLVMSEEAWKEHRYLKAYAESVKGLAFQPGHPELITFQERLMDEWCGILYNEAVQAQNNGRFAAAKAKFTELSKYKPGFLDTEELLLEVTSTLASDSYDKAERIMGSDSRDRIGTAVVHYLLVREEHSSLYPDINEKIEAAKRLLRKELEFRIALDFQNSSAEPGAAGLVKEQILNRMKRSKALKNIAILDRDSIDDILREQGLGQGFLDETTAIEVKKIKGIQAGIRGEVIKLVVRESGRDRPSYGSSRYVSGTRHVPNPAHQQAQAAVQSSQQNVLQAQSDLNNQQQQNNQMMKQNTNSQYGGLLAGLGQISSALNEGALNKAKRDLAEARRVLARTPLQIEENIESDYRYEIFDLRLQGEIVIALKVVNYTTSEISEVHTIRKRDEVADRYVPGDPGKNVRSDPMELPTIDAFKSKLIAKAIDETFESLVKELGNASDSYFKAGRKAEDMRIESDAVEKYMRFIYSAPNLKDKRVQYANEYIYDRLGLRVIRKKN